MNELIERLKTNESPHRIFADMTPEKQACLKAVPVNYREYLTFKSEKQTMSLHWSCCDAFGSALFPMNVYRIKSDYQPEPEYVDYPVATFESGGERWLGIFRGTVNAWTHLHCLPSLPGFRGFWDELNIWIEGDKVAECIANGSKVIARFENLCPR